MLRCVPAAVPGIVFLSGGHRAVKATLHLNALNEAEKTPWELSFSFGRALQEPALTAWKGHNINDAQKALIQRAQQNSLARFAECREEG